MRPLLLLLGPTASGKTALSIALAQRFSGEVLSCDSVAVYRHMQLGTAKPTSAERALVPHHLLDLYDPTETCTAGDYARHARAVLTQLSAREIPGQPATLPLLAGGTGLYARALLDGLSPAPPANPTLRARLLKFAQQTAPFQANAHRAAAGEPPQQPLSFRAEAQRAEVEEPPYFAGASPTPFPHPNASPTTSLPAANSRLHRLLIRLHPHAATLIHPNDTPKLIRAIEVSLAARRPITEQWQGSRDALTGYRILRLTLAPPREALCRRIDARAAAMFSAGLVEETRTLIQRFGPACRPFQSLGYKQAAEVLGSQLTEPEAVAATAQGHRQYSKRQLTWFRREAALHPETHWLPNFGDDPVTLTEASALVAAHLFDCA